MKNCINLFTNLIILLTLLACPCLTFASTLDGPDQNLKAKPLKTRYLKTQAEVDAFRIETSVDGNLFITGHDITKIDLSNLDYIGGTLKIFNNPQLTVIEARNDLIAIGDSIRGGSIIIQNNISLLEIHGFFNLDVIYGPLVISNNLQLYYLNAFTNVKIVTGLVLHNNNAIRLPAAFKLTSIICLATAKNANDGKLIIKGNDALLHVDFLQNLMEIRSKSAVLLSIENNNRLSNIDGLRFLKSIEGKTTTINIFKNKGLSNVDGLSGLMNIDRKSHITVKNNPKLARCCGLYNLLTLVDSHFVTVSHNGSGCTTGDIQAGGPCPPSPDCYLNRNPIVLTNQDQIDHFRQLYGCTRVYDLKISGNDITNLDGLSDITVIASSLDISDNPLLTNINGLKSFATFYFPGFIVPRGITISNNPSLKNIDGLSSLTSLNGTITINNNPLLTSLKGLSSVNGIVGDIVISNNAALKNLNGLSSLKRVLTDRYYSKFYIINNDALTDIDGLSKLTEINGYKADLQVVDNDKLTNIDGLSSLTTLHSRQSTSNLTISENDILQDIDGLSALKSFSSPFTVNIVDNPMLSMCCAALNFIYAGPYQHPIVAISGNAPSCTFEEITRVGGPCIPYATNAPAEDTFTGAERTLALYPNPNNGAFDLSINGIPPGEYHLVVKDLSGNILRNANLVIEDEALKLPIDLRPLPKGLYVVSVENHKGSIVRERVAVNE